MQESPSPAPHSPADTREKLLDAAARIFARDGLAGSTTREIAREAGVNEVTLFRHFHTKEGLITAVVGRNFGAAPGSALTAPCTWSGDLRKDLHSHARRYEQLLTDNLALIRTMIGEIQHHGDHERQVFKAIFRPLREALAARLTSAIQSGELPAEASAEILADLFNAMIFTGVLRRNGSQPKLAYSATSYVNAAVELIAGGARQTS